MTGIKDQKPELAELMRADWDRRVRHDHRFWMSDGYGDDQSMWESGERDFLLMCGEIALPGNKTLLDLGCGIGRLLRSAQQRFEKVIGVDVSQAALVKARELLNPAAGLELIQGNGLDLQPVADESVDVVLSFAALTSMPTEVIAGYLVEIRRVLRPDGLAKLQVYIGQEQPVRRTDTLHLRCFKEHNFRQGLAAAGLEVMGLEPLLLPFVVSNAEAGFTAMKATLRRSASPAAAVEVVSGCLLPAGEASAVVEEPGEELEYWMTVNYAKELAAEGNWAKARETLEYAVNFSQAAGIDIRDLWDRIIAELDQRVAPATSERPSGADRESASLCQRNLKILAERFPKVQQLVTAELQRGRNPDVEVRMTAEGPALYWRGQCLDHGTKPKSSGAAWAKRVLSDRRLLGAKEFIIFGMGGAYHIAALLERSTKPLIVVEPLLPVLTAAVECLDLSGVLEKISALTVTVDQEWEQPANEAELVIRPQTQAVAAAALRELRSRFYAVRGLQMIRPKIAVAGPVMGGTLPIMSYTANALAFDGQRVRTIDVSGFSQGYGAIDGILGSEMIRAGIQGSYVEMISKVILASVTEKPVDILICMALAPLIPETLIELRKRGVITVLWFVEDYLRFTTWQQMAPYYDFIFTIQKDGCIEAIKQAGCSEVHYIPTACDPLIHSPLALTPEEQDFWGAPISFMGAGYHNRQQMFAALANMPFKIWGTEWPTCKPFDKMVQEKGRRLKPEEYIKIFNATKVNLNLHSSTERDGVDPHGDFLNPRTFELAAIGAFQLVDERKLLPEAFDIGQEVVTFRDTEELKEKIAYYLEHDDERREIATRARRRVLREHTYQHRLRQMLSIIYSSRFEQLQQRSESEPWQKVLHRAKQYPELYERCLASYRRGEEPDLEGLVSDIVAGRGSLSDVEQKLLFLFHISKQIIRMRREEMGGKGIGSG